MKSEQVHNIMNRRAHTYLHCAAAQVQDLGTVIQALFLGLRIRSQAQQVGIKRHGYGAQSAFVDLCRQTALLLQAAFIRLVAPKVTHIHHLQERSKEDPSISPIHKKI